MENFKRPWLLICERNHQVCVCIFLIRKWRIFWYQNDFRFAFSAPTFSVGESLHVALKAGPIRVNTDRGLIQTDGLQFTCPRTLVCDKKCFISVLNSVHSALLHPYDPLEWGFFLHQWDYPCMIQILWEYKRCFMFIWTNLKLPYLIHFLSYLVIINLHWLIRHP